MNEDGEEDDDQVDPYHGTFINIQINWFPSSGPFSQEIFYHQSSKIGISADTMESW